MNAIVALCHFCEAHGPRVLFCTYSGGGTDVAAAATPLQTCAACGSVGADTVLASRADDGSTYYSRESLPSSELTAMLRQAAIRSLTCEVSWSADGGCVYFSEGSLCHVLSCSFQLSDSRARGLRRWFSCLVLMKDRLQLLNLMPFFSEHIQKSASELKALTAAVFDEEQRVCSQRALRLNRGHNDFGPSRCLKQLTGDESIFHKLHMSHTWMLHAGANTYTETLHTSRDLLARIHPPALTGSIFAPGACDVKEGASLRWVRDVLGKEAFRNVVYCALTGIELILKSDNAEHAEIIRSLGKLIPVPPAASERIPNMRCTERGDDLQANATRCVLQQNNNNIECRWPGTLPPKCPALMSRIDNAVNNNNFTDVVLDQHIKSLQLEWLGIANALKNALLASGPQSGPVTQLKQALGISPHDELLVNYWMQSFCA